MRGLWLMLAVTLMLAGCRNDEPPEKLVTTSKRFEPLYARLSAIGRAYPKPATYAESPCPEKLRPFRQMAWHVVRTAHEDPDELLGAFVNHRGVKVDRGLWGPPSEYLTLPKTMQEHQTPASVWRRRQKELDELEGLLDAKHVRTIHVVTRKEAELFGRKFASGHIEAWVLTFELETAKLICTELITSDSSDSVTFGGDTTAELALERDLAKRLGEKLEAHEKAIAPFIVPIH